MFKLIYFCVICIVFTNKFITGKLLYFPSTNVEMTLIGKQNMVLKPNETTIFIARTYMEPTQSALQDNIRYQNVRVPVGFEFNNNTGEIKIRQDFFVKTKDQEFFTLEIFAVDSNNINRNATFKMKILVKLLHNEDFSCERYVNHLCFWPEIKYQVLENQKPSFLGLLSSQYYKNKCKDYNLFYTVSKGKAKIKLEQQQFSQSWYLLTNVSLDRDVYGSMKRPANFSATINCFVNNSKAHFEHSAVKMIDVEILDEDDNPLIPDMKPVVDVCVNTMKVRKNENLDFQTPLLFEDGDTYDANNYETKILQDYENLLSVSCRKIENHVFAKTGYFCEMHYRKEYTFKKLPYTTQLKITDTSLGQMYGNRSIVVTIHIKLCDKTTTVHPPSELLEHTTKPTRGEMYPFIETKILRTAAPYARVAQASHAIQNINLYKFQIKHDTSWALSKNKMAAFNITAKNGIVYVQNIDILRMKTLTTVDLIIEWSFENDSKNHGKWSRGSDLLRITIVGETTITCAEVNGEVNNWSLCATFDTVKKCHEACGLATGGYNTLKHVDKIAHRGTRCTWRGNGTKSTVYQTNDYQTCTPDIKTCPDAICDDLERLHYGICPQDCTIESVILGNHNKNDRGIKTGLGVCTCDETNKCVCGNFATGKAKNRKDIGVQANLNEADKQFVDSNVHEAPTGNKCGPFCFAGLGVGTTLIVIIMGVLLCRVRTWRSMGIREHKYISSVTALSHGYSTGTGGDYVHQTTSTNNTTLTPGSMPGNGLEFNFTMNVSISKKYTPDPKWEFPRQNLQIDQILGEGEFGRVLKARARDIANVTGFTTVAVKTLKENAQGSELDDLISEYELLKEVSHPNVIRLLGVSMLPDGPAYLIIEYAEFGSLRNYLRKSRHLEVENINLKCHEYNLIPTQAQEESFSVTAKDILSFAWQISKGMAYLGDKKLVHRDLAARNVLVASGKTCKISDFGLTRDVYEDNAYLKRSKGRVPIKWMAPESLADHVYTNRSDVWSFGILLWELVTLGGSPYPGVAVENLFTLLRSGYRMEKPPNCSIHLYSVMQKCWEIDPVERPSFRSLTEKFETMLEDGVEYLNLNLHTVQNKAYFSTLSDTSNPTSDESKQLNIPKYGNDCISPKQDPFIENLNEAKMALTKCGEVEKLPSWAVSQNMSPTLKSNDYQNENNQIGMSHYEVPKNPNNNNMLTTNLISTNDNKIHLSYIDMTSNATTNQNVEEKPLLRTQSYDNLPSQQKITQV